MGGEESLRRAIHEEVALSPWDPGWAGIFEAERARLAGLFPGALSGIEHIGSTAVPGMRAKPVVDMMGAVGSMAEADALVERLCQKGWEASAEFNATLADSRWLMRWSEGRRTHHMHLVMAGGEQWRDRLAFRDALRSDPALAGRYAGLKDRLSREHREDRELYTEAKGEFIRAALAAGAALRRGGQS